MNKNTNIGSKRTKLQQKKKHESLKL